VSKIGKKPILIPEGVSVNIEDNVILVKGPKGENSLKLNKNLEISKKENKIMVLAKSKSKDVRALHGLYRMLIFNLVEGVVNGFEKKLQLHGLGYRVASGNTEDGKQKLTLFLGFSHPIDFIAKEGINFALQKNNIIVSGIDKQQVGETAAKIRALRPPEPYKGKGIRYADEVVHKKPGKAVVKTQGV